MHYLHIKAAINKQIGIPKCLIYCLLSTILTLGHLLTDYLSPAVVSYIIKFGSHSASMGKNMINIIAVRSHRRKG